MIRGDRIVTITAAPTVRQIRQGDVLLTRVEPPEGDIRRPLDDSGQPLAGLLVPGERTGHAHRLPARVYDAGGRRLLMLERPTPLVHEEHQDIEVPAGWWEVTLQREYAPRANRGRWSVD
jgi:hypothetical protein